MFGIDIGPRCLYGIERQRTQLNSGTAAAATLGVVVGVQGNLSVDRSINWQVIRLNVVRKSDFTRELMAQLIICGEILSRFYRFMVIRLWRRAFTRR